MEEEHKGLLQAIHKTLRDIHEAAKGRPNIDQVYQISANNPYVVDYRDRYHVLIWASSSLTLTVEDLGTIQVGQAWTDISFRAGMKLYAQGQSSLVPVLIRCTDSTVG